MDKQTVKINEQLARLGISGLEGPGENSIDSWVLWVDYFVDPKSGAFFIRYEKAVIEHSGDAGKKFEIIRIDKEGNVAEKAHVMPGISLEERSKYFKSLKKITKDEFFKKYKKRR